MANKTCREVEKYEGGQPWHLLVNQLVDQIASHSDPHGAVMAALAAVEALRGQAVLEQQQEESKAGASEPAAPPPQEPASSVLSDPVLPDMSTYLESFPNCNRLVRIFRSTPNTFNKTPLAILHEYVTRVNLEVSHPHLSLSPPGLTSPFSDWPVSLSIRMFPFQSPEHFDLPPIPVPPSCSPFPTHHHSGRSWRLPARSSTSRDAPQCSCAGYMLCSLSFHLPAPLMSIPQYSSARPQILRPHTLFTRDIIRNPMFCSWCTQRSRIPTLGPSP